MKNRAVFGSDTLNMAGTTNPCTEDGQIGDPGLP
jgi:hypothetical protein